MEGEKIISDVVNISQETPEYIGVLEQCIVGNEKAKEELYELFNTRVFNICNPYMKRKCQTEEVVNDVFLKVFSKLSALKKLNSFEPWLMKISRNMAINAYKTKQIREKAVLIEDMSIFLPKEDVDVLPEYPNHNKLLQLIRDIVTRKNFPEGYRQVLELYYKEGLSHQEISNHLQISKNTSKSQLKKAKAKIQRILQQDESRQCR